MQPHLLRCLSMSIRGPHWTQARRVQEGLRTPPPGARRAWSLPSAKGPARGSSVLLCSKQRGAGSSASRAPGQLGLHGSVPTPAPPQSSRPATCEAGPWEAPLPTRSLRQETAHPRDSRGTASPQPHESIRRSQKEARILTNVPEHNKQRLLSHHHMHLDPPAAQTGWAPPGPGS